MNNITPRKLALILLVTGVFLAVGLFNPIKEVFAGNWKLQQQIELFNISRIQIGSPDWVIGNTVLNLDIPVGTISIRYYSIMILGGLLAGYALALFLAAQQHVVGSIVDRLLIGILIFGIIGARLFFVVFNWNLYSDNPWNILLGLPQGGMAIFGAMIGGILYLTYYTVTYRFNIYEFIDFIAPSLLLGQIFGRWGNFFNYEAYGPSTSVIWKMFVPDTANISQNLNDRFFHPTFLYEIIPNFVLLLFLLYNYQSFTRKHSGLIFGFYAIGYGIIRLITEFFRLDALKINLPIRVQLGFVDFDYLLVSQFTALLLLIIGVWIIWKRSQIVYKKKDMMELRFS